jgi:hypothetical protein
MNNLSPIKRREILEKDDQIWSFFSLCSSRSSRRWNTQKNGNASPPHPPRKREYCIKIKTPKNVIKRGRRVGPITSNRSNGPAARWLQFIFHFHSRNPLRMGKENIAPLGGSAIKGLRQEEGRGQMLRACRTGTAARHAKQSSSKAARNGRTILLGRAARRATFHLSPVFLPGAITPSATKSIKQHVHSVRLRVSLLPHASGRKQISFRVTFSPNKKFA